MNTARIVVLTIAPGAGGIAAYLASGSNDQLLPAEPVVRLQTLDALVACSDTGQGRCRSRQQERPGFAVAQPVRPGEAGRWTHSQDMRQCRRRRERWSGQQYVRYSYAYYLRLRRMLELYLGGSFSSK